MNSLLVYPCRDLPRNFIKTLSISVSSSAKSKIPMTRDNLIVGEHYMGVCMLVCVCVVNICMYVCICWPTHQWMLPYIINCLIIYLLAGFEQQFW